MSPLLVVVLVVLIDLLGFSLVIPLLPRYGEIYGLNELQIGVLLAAFPVCQLLAGPILGSLSDRYGRRPILILSQLGTTLSFVMLAFSNSFLLLLIARMLDGASGGNILVAQAYVADVTKPADRAKSLGLIGAAFGVGFTIGPLLGGLLLSVPIDPEWRLRLPFLLAAVCSMIAWLLVLFRLPESISLSNASRTKARVFNLQGLRDIFSSQLIGRLVLLGFLVILAFATLEGTYSLFLGRRMGWSPQRASYWFALFGLIGILVQGGLIRVLVPRFGEAALIRFGLAGMAVGFVVLANTKTAPMLFLGSVLVAFHYSLCPPSVLGLLSRATPASEQGAVFGVYASTQTFARIVSYLVATWLLGRYGAGAPYWEAAMIAVVALGFGVLLGSPHIKAHHDDTSLSEPELDAAPEPTSLA